MPISAFISDVHGNLEALRVVLADIDNEGISSVACLGDTVGYGAAPGRCIELIKKHCSSVVIGNHEIFTTLPMELDKFHPAVRGGIELARTELSKKQMNWLRDLPLVLRFADATIVHASLDAPLMFHHLTTKKSAERHFEHQQTPVCFIGHTHKPLIFEESTSRIRLCKSQRDPIRLNTDFRYIINVGSVGQPRDGDPRACYVIYDSDTFTVQHRRVLYDIEASQARIRDRGLDDSVADRLAKGR